ncbi:MAG: hypothetical protein AAF206_29675 [Bacteroidota bacterium]
MKTEQSIRLPWWWYLVPAYLTLWTIGFSLWSYIDGRAMMDAFGIETGSVTDFILLNSAGRYIALGAAMVLGIWVFRSYFSILTALLARLTMDVMDLAAGLQTGIIQDTSGVGQSFLMFLLPNLIAVFLLYRMRKKQSID